MQNGKKCDILGEKKKGRWKMKDLLKHESANETNPKWEKIMAREKPLYRRKEDLRSEVERDYTRIINSNSYRRLKHKTQVFFSPENDHICTRSEHVSHIDSVSYTIAKYLGLNLELTRAIASAHDIGHSPFGHEGERILSELLERDVGEKFWHEKNGLDCVDKIEILEDNQGNKQNLNLTYGTRDGIISHCGEIDENHLKPREEYIDLQKEYVKPNQFSPYTWEGCVVKVADKISYLGRDIEDAITVGILDEHLDELHELLRVGPDQVINNTVIIHKLIRDLCDNTTLEKGLCFSNETFDWINRIKAYNFKYICKDQKVLRAIPYFELIIHTIYEILKESYDGGHTIQKLQKAKKYYPDLIGSFEEWIRRYWNLERDSQMKNDIVFHMENEKEYNKAIIYYISGMTDNFAIETYNKIVRF